MPNICPSILDVWDVMTEAFILSVLYILNTVMSMVGCLVALVDEMHRNVPNEFLSELTFCYNEIMCLIWRWHLLVSILGGLILCESKTVEFMFYLW
jgi:hypothetical protein